VQPRGALTDRKRVTTAKLQLIGICISCNLLDINWIEPKNKKFIVNENLITVVLVINHNNGDAAIQ
jgi:hypothetical protein